MAFSWNILSYRHNLNCKYGITYLEKTSLCTTLQSFLAPIGPFKGSKDCQQGRENIRQLCQWEQLSWAIRHIYVGNINIHLHQKALIEKCSVNKGVLQKAVMLCTMFQWWKSLKNTCLSWFYFTQFAGVYPKWGG